MQHLLQGSLRRNRRDNRLGLWLLVVLLAVLAVSILSGLARMAA